MVNFTLPSTTNEMISISTSQTFRSWVVIFHLRRPMAFLSLNLYDTPGLALRMNVLFWGPGDFPVSYLNRDTSWNAWIRHSGSFMVDTGIFSINNPDFENYLGQMYPAELEIKDTTESNTSSSYLDLLLSIESDGQLRSSLYDKRDDFNFHITNFPFLSSNIQSSPANGVLISQLIRYARACSSYECSILRAARLSSKLLGQG